MNKKFFKSTTSLLLIVFLFAITSLTNVGIFVKKVFADGTTGEDNFIGYPITENLYEQTNTFTYNSTEKTYNVNEAGRITDANVSDGQPLITVITHGLGGSASHWSNNTDGNFAPDEDSILSVLNATYESKTGQDANIYWAKVLNNSEEDINFKLIPLVSENIKSNGEYNENGNTITHITDISKHIIIVFEATENVSNGFNNQVYEEFNYILREIKRRVCYE